MNGHRQLVSVQTLSDRLSGCRRSMGRIDSLARARRIAREVVVGQVERQVSVYSQGSPESSIWADDQPPGPSNALAPRCEHSLTRPDCEGSQRYSSACSQTFRSAATPRRRKCAGFWVNVLASGLPLQEGRPQRHQRPNNGQEGNK